MASPRRRNAVITRRAKQRFSHGGGTMATSAHCALGAGVGGVALAIGGWAAPTIIAAIIGVLAVTIAAAIIPEQMTARKPAAETTRPPADRESGQFPR